MGNNPVQRLLPDDPNGYYAPLRAAWDVTWTLRDLDQPSGNQTLCLFPGLASYVLTRASADASVAFHRAVTFRRGFDGLYIDMLTDNWFTGTFDARLRALARFDCDGDGAPNSVLDLQTQWKGWRNYLVTQLRAAAGPDKILIANTAGPMSLAPLNGITIEMEWCGNDMAACLDAVVSSRAQAHQPPLDVFWLTQAQQVPPATQCKLVYEMASRFNDSSVFAGSDVYDGSDIVCNHSTGAEVSLVGSA